MILIALGANLDGPYGPPERALRMVCTEFFKKHDLSVVAASSVWKTAPVPISDQPWYKNAVCAVETKLSPRELLSMIKGIERDFGRAICEINAPRVIDLDILCYNDVVMTDGDLVLPHARMHERGFVLYPLQEIISRNWRHPVIDKSVDEMIADLPKGQELQRLKGSSLL